MEAKFLARLAVSIDISPATPVVRLLAVDDRLVLARTPPIGNQLGIGQRLEHDFPWRVERSLEDDVLLAGLDDHFHVAHGLLSPCVCVCSFLISASRRSIRSVASSRYCCIHSDAAPRGAGSSLLGRH